MKKGKMKEDILGLKPFGVLVEGVKNHSDNIHATITDSNKKKAAIAQLFKMIVDSSKLTASEKKRVSSALNLLINKGI